MRFGPAAGVVLLAFAVAGAAFAGEGRPVRTVSGPIDNDAVWEGRVRVEGTVAVRAGVRLTVRPGAEILFAKGALLEVSGSLRAAGTPDLEIRFSSAEPAPARGDWKGIVLLGAAENSVLHRAVVTDAEAVQVQAGAVEITDCTLERMITGVFMGKDTSGTIARNTITDMTNDGVDCQVGSGPRISGNTISRCGKSGVVSQRNAVPAVSGNRISRCNAGIRYGSPAPSPEGNRLDNNVAGMVLNNVGGGMAVLSNRFSGNGTGLWIENFSSPRVEGNAIDGNDTGIFCFRSSSPGIVRNRIAGNKTGIACSQMSAPAIRANEISGNSTGVMLTLSAYARVNGNNIENNAVQMKLDNMSHDWEVRVGKKPDRGGFARGLTKAEKGIAPSPSAGQFIGETIVGGDRIDASGNWWGEKDTAEMKAKGPDADIGGLVDGYDQPTRSYEGYPGEYLQDRIDYRDWKTSRIPDAGLRDSEGEVPSR